MSKNKGLGLVSALVVGAGVAAVAEMCIRDSICTL